MAVRDSSERTFTWTIRLLPERTEDLFNRPVRWIKVGDLRQNERVNESWAIAVCHPAELLMFLSVFTRGPCDEVFQKKFRSRGLHRQDDCEKSRAAFFLGFG